VAKSWSKATQVKSVKRPAPPAKSAPAATAQALPQSAATAAVRTGAEAHGSFQVQVAAVRSAQEAADVAARVQQRFARDLGGRAPVVDQTVIGSMGTIYRVQIGPFASSGETQTLCAKLKGAGMDCRIVAAAR
jgi:cell division septation protein DedD